ncbi:trypsin-like serine protease [Corynebacterium guaraldiae]
MHVYSRSAVVLTAVATALVLTACGSFSSPETSNSATPLDHPSVSDSERRQGSGASGTTQGFEEVLDGDAIWDNSTEIPHAELLEPRNNLYNALKADYMDVGVLTPGAPIYNGTNGGRCSTGHFAGDGQRLFILTAGHCGDTGDTFYYEDQSGSTVEIGQMVKKARNTNTDSINSADIALIEVSNPAAEVSTAPAFNAPLAGWMSLEDVTHKKPTMCFAGSAGGAACDDFIDRFENQGLFTFGSESVPGDSGGPVYASIDGKLYAVGVLSFGNYDDYTGPETGAMEIGNTMEQFNLKLYS